MGPGVTNTDMDYDLMLKLKREIEDSVSKSIDELEKEHAKLLEALEKLDEEDEKDE